MLGLVKEISGQKTIVPLTTDTGTGAPVGSLISQYKKVPMSGYLYCDGSTFDETAYPALYLYLGSNVLPDYRECVMVGAEQNTTDTITTHDVYTQGEFKDDQLEEHYHHLSRSNSGTEPIFHQNNDEGSFHGALVTTTTGQNATPITTTFSIDGARSGTTTHGKQKAVYVYIKATSGLAENQQENVLNAINENNRYSTTETTTGQTWIDDKPIYRKVVEVASLPNNTQISYSHGIVNADSFVTVRGIAKSTTLSLPIPFVERTGATNIQIYAQAASFDISTNYDASSYAGTIIFEYTKTTD